jgi:hypothetical protein
MRATTFLPSGAIFQLPMFTTEKPAYEDFTRRNDASSSGRAQITGMLGTLFVFCSLSYFFLISRRWWQGLPASLGCALLFLVGFTGVTDARLLRVENGWLFALDSPVRICRAFIISFSLHGHRRDIDWHYGAALDSRWGCMEYRSLGRSLSLFRIGRTLPVSIASHFAYLRFSM